MIKVFNFLIAKRISDEYKNYLKPLSNFMKYIKKEKNNLPQLCTSLTKFSSLQGFSMCSIAGLMASKQDVTFVGTCPYSVIKTDESALSAASVSLLFPFGKLIIQRSFMSLIMGRNPFSSEEERKRYFVCRSFEYFIV